MMGGSSIWSTLLLSMLATASVHPVGWRAASSGSPRLTYRFQDVPLCEMMRAESLDSIRPGLLERWWNGGAPVTVQSIDLAGEKPVTEVCIERIKRRDVDELTRLISANFWYSYMTPSGQEARVPLGYMNATTPMIYAHKTFHTFGDKLFNVVPSAPMPLKTDHDLRLSYNVISHDDVKHLPTPMINQLIWYNALCTAFVVGVLYIVLRADALPRSQPCVTIAMTEIKFEILTTALGCGSQLFTTFVLLPLIVALSGSNSYSIYKFLIAFSLGYLANGFMLIRMFRRYRVETNLFRTVLSALVLSPALGALMIWHLNLLFTEVGSSRMIPMFMFLMSKAVVKICRALSEFLVYTLLICTPLHYAGAVLSYRYSIKGANPAPAKEVEKQPKDYSALILGLVPFGSTVLCMSEFLEIMFGPQQGSFATPTAFLVSIFTYVCVVATTSIAALRLNSKEDWTTVPVGLAQGTSAATFLWLAYWTFTRYLLSASTVVELATYTLVLGVVSGVVTLAVSYLSCEVFYSRLAAGGSQFLNKPQF